MMSTESSSSLTTSANAFPSRGISVGERVGTHVSFPTSTTSLRFLAMSDGGMTECSHATSSGASVVTMSRRKSMLNSTSTFLLREVP